jgi:hypothetical protein
VAKLVAALKQTPPTLPGDPLVHPSRVNVACTSFA